MTLASATVTTTPTFWEASIGDTTGTDQLYETVATINPASATGATVVPTWSTPFAVTTGTGGGSSTIEVNGVTQTNPDFQDSTANRGVAWTAIAGNVQAIAGADNTKQDNLSTAQLNVCLLYTSPSPRDS